MHRPPAPIGHRLSGGPCARAAYHTRGSAQSARRGFRSFPDRRNTPIHVSLRPTRALPRFRALPHMDNAARPSAHPLLGFVRHIVTYETMRARHRGRDRSPNSTLALLSVDARLTPAENVRCPASTTDRRDICLLLTQDAGFLKGRKKPERSEASRPPLCSDPSFGKRFTNHLRG